MSEPVGDPGADERDPGDLVRKRATGAGRARLRREAEVLDAHRHPGVVELVEHVDTDDETVIVTQRVGERSLAAITPTGLAEVAGVIAATADIVADLHRDGLVHGRLEPSHVLLTATGRPVLCGFGDAGAAGTPRLDASISDDPWSDPAARRGGERTPAGDVYAIGAILHDLLERCHPPRGGWMGAEPRVRRQLGRIVASAMRADRRLRPDARSMATAVASAVPTAELPARPAGADPSTETRPWRTRPPRPLPTSPRRTGPAAAVGGVTLVALVTLVAGWWLIGRPSGSPGPSPVEPPSELRSATIDEPCVPAPSTVCADRVAIRSGVVDTGDMRYAVGDPGDLVVVGDWDCDGSATAAVLRPATGEVFVFDRWARPGEELEVRPVVRLAGADRIDVVPVSPTCHRLAVGHRDGRWVYDYADA